MTLKINIMTKKLSKEAIEKKKKYHEKRSEFYAKKLEESEQRENRAGFRWYD